MFGQPPGLAKSEAMAAPALPYFDRGACPFEGCTYHQWIVRDSITLYDTWKPERREIATLSKGDKATGITGVVITYRPGTIRMERDLPEQSLKQGETILTYAYRGEGFAAAWFHGRFYDEFDISFAKWPDGTGCGGAHCAATYVDLGDKRWWAEVKLNSGAVGWVDMDHGLLGGFDF